MKYRGYSLEIAYVKSWLNKKWIANPTNQTYTTSEKLSEQISCILRELGIENTCIRRTDKIGRKPLYVVRVL